MSIWNKILVGLIAVTAVFYSYFAARVLKTHVYWRNSFVAHQAALENAKAETTRLLYGDKSGALGIVQLKNKLHALRLIDQGGQVWTNCAAHVDAQAGKVSLTLETAPGVLVPAKTTLYAFDSTPIKDGGRYLGEFRVTEVADKQLVLQPARLLSQRELDRLSQAKGPWTVCTVLPADNHALLAGKTEEQLKTLLPADSIAEYVRDGKAADAKDPPDRVAGGKFMRPLRDYGRLLEHAFADRTLMNDALKSWENDKRYLDDALASAGKTVEALQADLALLKQQAAKYEAERKAVAEHLKRVDDMASQLKQSAAALLQSNQQSAAELSKIERSAAAHIDRRAGDMARSETSR